MAVYYFDLRDGSEIVPDEEGMDLSDLVAVQEEAARALANLSWDTVRNFAGAQSHTMSVEVRDSAGPVLQVRFTCEIIRKQ